MTTFLRKPVPFKQAAEWIRSKPVVSREAFTKLLPELRVRAFLISGITAFDVAEDIRNAIAKIPEGAIWGDVRKKIASDLVPYFVDPQESPEMQEKQQRAAEKRAELLIRTHGFQAYQAANHEAMERNKDALPYWQYLTMDDSRVRESHAALNGIVLPADSPFWKSHFPPWDWNCRCQVVPLADDDVAELRALDSRREPENRRVLGPEAQRVLETEERLVRGNKTWSVTSPANKPPDKGGFSFDPAALRIPLEALEARYSPEIWREFQTWAKATEIGDGRTLWTWLEGKTEIGKVESGKAGTGDGQLGTGNSELGTGRSARQSPVSNALAVEMREKAAAREVRETIADIDKVHDDGKLPRIALDAKAGRGSLGVYVSNNEGKAMRIGISAKGSWKRLTAAHEIGHFLDHQALDVPGFFASERSPLLDAWRKAVRSSQALAELADAPINWNAKHYFLQLRECFARSYAQWIAERAGNPALLEEVAKARLINPWRQWTKEDFAPIAKALDDVFGKKGWL